MNAARINYRSIKYFLVASEVGSFRRASQMLGVEQSCISRRIREMEQEIGAPLFLRHGSGVELTNIGLAFRRQVRRGSDLIEAAFTDARTSALGASSIRIGVFGPLSMGFLPHLFADFRRKRPWSKLEFSEGDCADLVAAVRRAQLDLAFVAEAAPGNGLELLHLWEEPVYIAMSATNRLAEKTSLSWNDLRDSQCVVTSLATGEFAARLLQRHIADPSGAFRVERLAVTRESLMQIVAHGGEVTLSCSGDIRLGVAGVVFRPIRKSVLRFGAAYPSTLSSSESGRLLGLAAAMSRRPNSWFARQHLIRPVHPRGPHVDRYRGAPGRTRDRLQ